MHDPFASHAETQITVPPQKLRGTVAGLFIADDEAGGAAFVTRPVEHLTLNLEGIEGDHHAGQTRRSGSREPWYPRGTEMRNERQLSILSTVELATVARRLRIPELRAEWIGGNLVLDGIPDLTDLPPRTVLFFDNGATIRIDGDNAPCRIAGRSIAEQFDNRADIELAFPQQSQNMRGLVGWVEKTGTLTTGEGFEARIPEQRLYRVDG